LNKNRVNSILVIFVVILAFTVTGCGIVRKNPEVEKNSVVAKVNNQVIIREEFMESFELYKNSYENQYGKDVWDQDIEGRKLIDVVKGQVVEKMIMDKLILEEAAQQGIQVAQEEVEEEVKNFKEYVGNDEKFEEFLTTQNMSEEKFKEQVKENLIIFKYREKVVGDVKISDQDVRAYYDSNIKEFKADQVKASHILVNTEEEAGTVLEKVEKGEDFNKLAEEYSVDPSAKTNKGDLGYFGYGEMAQPFEEAAFALDVGEVSDIVKTQFGYHIIKVTDKQIVDPTPFEEVKEGIEDRLLYDAREKKFNEIIRELREQAEIETYPENM